MSFGCDCPEKLLPSSQFAARSHPQNRQPADGAFNGSPGKRNAAYGHTQEIPKAPKRRGEASVRFGQQREPSRESVPRDFHSGHSSTQAEDAHGNATSLLPKSQTYDSEFQSAKVARIAGGIDEASFLIEIMKKTPLFRNVCTQEAAELISDMTRHTFRANQYVRLITPT